MLREKLIKRVISKIDSKKPSVEEMFDFMNNPHKKPTWEELKEISKKYQDKWLDAEVLEINPPKFGKGLDVKVKLRYPDLPSIIDTDSVKANPEIKVKDLVKVKLYFSAGGILIEELRPAHTYH